MKNIDFDHERLESRINAKYRFQNAFANALGISGTALSRRLSNEIPFTANEIKAAADLLEIRPEEIALYFLTPAATALL